MVGLLTIWPEYADRLGELYTPPLALSTESMKLPAPDASDDD
jgi:hypothetical protein